MTDSLIDGLMDQLAQGSEYAFELCDPVQNDSYHVSVNGTMVSLSNFIFPSWFNSEAKVPQNLPFDYMSNLKAPFTMSDGGYMIVRQAGQESQVLGEGIPLWRQKQIKSKWYRR